MIALWVSLSSSMANESPGAMVRDGAPMPSLTMAWPVATMRFSLAICYTVIQ
jgi:hypothetical protein